jgi:hypothetical protein
MLAKIEKNYSIFSLFVLSYFRAFCKENPHRLLPTGENLSKQQLGYFSLFCIFLPKNYTFPNFSALFWYFLTY